MVSIAAFTFVHYVVALFVQKKVYFQELLKFMMCIFSQIMLSVCLSRAVMWKSGPMKELSVEIGARGGHCQIFPLKLDRLYISNEVNYICLC